MNVFAFLSLGSSFICAFLGLTVFILNRKALLNKIFTVILLVGAYWAFCEFMLHQASNVDVAMLWAKALFLWPFLLPLMVHFTLVFTENSLMKKKATYVLLYAPALIFSVIDLTTNLISSAPVMHYWGFDYALPTGSWVSHLDGVWAAALAVFVLVMLAIYYRRVDEENKKKQTKFIAIGFAIPIILSIVTDSIFPVLNVEFPALGNISAGIMSGFIVYAMWKYNLFTLSPAIAAETIVSTMPDSLVLADLNGKILRVNPSFTDLLEYTEKEVAGKPLIELCSDKTAENDFLKILFDKRVIKNYETTCRTKSGIEKSLAVSGSIVHSKRGEDVGFTCIIHDLTHRKQIEDRLVKAERYASIGALAGMVGHDLRNPLTSIRGATYYLKAKHKATLDDKEKAMFETIEKSIDYSDKIVNDLLDYSKDPILKVEPATAKGLIEKALAAVSVPPKITLINTAQEEHPLSVDKGKITRVIANILTNAFDAMPQGGTLTITSQKLGDCIQLSFQDTGSGMTSETICKLWTPLFTTKAKGMGFGLAICRRIVDAHGGKIWAESTVGKGTKITISLPEGGNEV